jgi:hypothetical protein
MPIRLGTLPAIAAILLLLPVPIAAQAAADEWTASFDGNALDTSKWERFTFEGGSGGTFKVSGGQLQMRAISGSRAGVRTRRKFTGERFIVEATLAKVGPPLPEPNTRGLPPGFANLTVLFDDSGRNRVEWIHTSDGRFEAWAVVDGRGERLDDHKLATKMANPTLGIVRRGDDFLFMLNGQMGLQRTVKNLPRDFWLMLYGYGSSENNWSSARVVTLKTTP